MSLHLQTFKTRTITAVLFAAVMLVGLFWNLWSFVILFTIIHFGSWYEFVKLSRKINKSRFLLNSFYGLIYITLPVLAMFDLGIEIRIYTNVNVNEIHYHQLIPCAIVFSIWINDTMAYIVGSLMGKTPFSKISPKKTWEGTIGGALLCVVVIAILGHYIPLAKGIAVQHWIAVAVICAVFGTAGDLLESKIKRMADVKDSGSFLPGHGGFLDRFDSLLVATPFVWLYINVFI